MGKFRIGEFEELLVLSVAVDEGAAVLDTILRQWDEETDPDDRPAGRWTNTISAVREKLWTHLVSEFSPAKALTHLKKLGNVLVHTAVVAAELDQGVRIQELKRQLGTAHEQFRRLEQSKADFISIAAHELKTPMTLVRGYADILLKEDRSAMSSEHINDVLRGIIKGTNRLQSTIEDMIDISMIDSQALTLRSEPVSIGTVIELAVGKLGAAARERKQTITVETFTGIPRIQGDSQRLHQVFMNVIGNGIKYTPDGGSITISSRLLKARGALEEDFVEIIVADTGIGIDKEDLEYIFSKFYRTESIALHSTGKTKFKGAGAGLGLAIAKGIVEAHGGRIWAESGGHDEDHCPGSEFHILLPVEARKIPNTKVIDSLQSETDEG